MARKIMPQTILMLDDEEVNVTLMQETLRRHLPGVEVVGFTDPHEALAWCALHEPDLCLVDFKMPQMSGVEFTLRARRQPNFQGIPVVMITGMTAGDVRRSALDNGVTEFLHKPINPEEVVVRCRNLLALRSSLQARTKDVTWLASDMASLPREMLMREQETIIQRLCHLSKARDEETGSHMHRMAAISQLIARELGCDTEFCDRILLAAPMHDIGKVGIPDRILLKPGKLDAEEWKVMQSHAGIGYEVLKDSDSPILMMGAEIAHAHHEKFNGEGYPNRIKGENISLVGRIVAVADVFDALVNKRHYKPAWDFGDAFALLRRESGQHFDPACVSALLRRIDGVMDIHQTFTEEATPLQPAPNRVRATQR
jgi:response regulator RpfG family c-di-GMP phosphodiesterase